MSCVEADKILPGDSVFENDHNNLPVICQVIKVEPSGNMSVKITLIDPTGREFQIRRRKTTVMMLPTNQKT